jgi:hypothetical protein
MKRRYLVAVLFLVAITLVVTRHWRSASESVPPPASAGASGASPASAGASAAEQAARREAASRLARMPPALPHAQVGKYSAEMIQSVNEAFRGMIAVRGLVIQDKERRALAHQILAMPDAAAMMREILLDPAFARSAFGDFQAESRFYAAAVLKEVARQGNLDFVSETAAGLAGQLAADGGEPDRGRAEDLMSVVAIVGESVGSEGLKDANSPALAKLGCTPDLARSVRVLCLRGLFQGVWAADGIEQAQAMVERLRTR